MHCLLSLCREWKHLALFVRCVCQSTCRMHLISQLAYKSTLSLLMSFSRVACSGDHKAPRFSLFCACLLRLKSCRERKPIRLLLRRPTRNDDDIYFSRFACLSDVKLLTPPPSPPTTFPIPLSGCRCVCCGDVDSAGTRTTTGCARRCRRTTSCRCGRWPRTSTPRRRRKTRRKWRTRTSRTRFNVVVVVVVVAKFACAVLRGCANCCCCFLLSRNLSKQQKHAADCWRLSDWLPPCGSAKAELRLGRGSVLQGRVGGNTICVWGVGS